MLKRICLLILPLVCCLFVFTGFLYERNSIKTPPLPVKAKVKKAVAIDAYPLIAEGEMAASPYLSKPVSYAGN